MYAPAYPQCRAPASRIAGDTDSHLEGAHEPWLAKPRTLARRERLGLGLEDKDSFFAEQCEFISLGSYCAVSRALQALDLKKYSYPFDWTRSPVEGLIKCLDQNFRSFFTYSFEAHQGPAGHLLGQSDWGGSFWHHDIREPKITADFVRRIDRMRGLREVPASAPRVFVRAVNSSGELL